MTTDPGVAVGRLTDEPEPLDEAPVAPRSRDAMSPLRYPGSKRRMVPALQALMSASGQTPSLFVEPFTGGGSVSLRLLELGVVSNVILADLDPLIASFWKVAADDTEWLIEAMKAEEVTVARWDYWRKVEPVTERDYALKCLFLNRTTFSGILHGRAGPIGGRAQTSDYKIDCRFNKEQLELQLRSIRKLRTTGKILDVWQSGWKETLEKLDSQGTAYPAKSTLLYLDPPYFEKANRLYNLAFTKEDHEELAQHLCSESEHRWILSYDEVPEFVAVYRAHQGVRWFRPQHTYTAKGGGRTEPQPGREILFTNLPTSSATES